MKSGFFRNGCFGLKFSGISKEKDNSSKMKITPVDFLFVFH